MNDMDREPLIPKHGGYRKLKSFQVAELVFDVTVRFCNRYVDRKSRTHDQMIQAARSGVQNIVEGSQASGTSKKSELKLTNVARASLEELRRDYEDFLRQRGAEAWQVGDARRGDLIDARPATADDVARWVQTLYKKHVDLQSECEDAVQHSRATAYAELAANAALTLIAVACSLLDRQLAAQAEAFESEGGFTERLYHRRKTQRDKD